MAIERIPCGGWDIDTSTLQFQGKVLKAVGGITGAYLPLSGGIMEADAVIEGTDELQIVVGDDSVAGAIGVTSQGVTLTRTNNGASASIRVIDDAVEIDGGDTSITINGTGINMGGTAITGLNSLSGNSVEIAIENQVDMNNHKITTMADPTDPQDAVTKQYVDNMIPVLDMGTVSDTPPVQLTITPEQVALAQQENAIVKITYQNITLQLQKIGQSATQVVFSGYVSDNNIYFFIDVTNTKANFNIAPTREVPITDGVQNGYGLLVQDGEAVWGAISSGGGLPTTGGTMKGAIDMDSNAINNLPNPSSATDAATKGYVDTTVSGYLKLSGGSITGTVSMNNNKITNVAAPSDNGDVANKQYVDNAIPVAATSSTLGTVKQISNIEQFTNPSSATAQEIADKFNNLIQNLINAGIMVAGN